MKIKDLPEEDRPREKLMAKGVKALSDAELIAILLGSGSPNETAVHLAQRILNSAKKNLNELAKLTLTELKTYPGIGDAKAIAIIAALELGKRRGSSEVIKRESIGSSHDAWLLFYPELADLEHEELWAAYVNHAGKVIRKTRISQGGINITTADVRVILKQALDVHATGIFLCHNHPSGSVRPSREDDQMTHKLKDAARVMDIRLLDHIILFERDYYSYGDEGRIV